MTSILVFLSNGASYHSDQSEYMPGPYEDGKGHAEFQEVDWILFPTDSLSGLR